MTTANFDELAKCIKRDREKWMHDRQIAVKEAIERGLSIEEFAIEIQKEVRYVGCNFVELALFTQRYLDANYEKKNKGVNNND